MTLKQLRTANGIEIYFCDPVSDSLNEPIIVLPGGPGLSSQLYQQYLKNLSSKHRIIFWDFANTGHSESRSENSFAADFNDLNQVIETLKLKSFSLLAHSYGGCLALKMATENAPLVRKLCLVSTTDYFLPVFKDMLTRKARKLSKVDFQELNRIYGKLAENSLLPEDTARLCEIEARCHFLKATPEQIKLFIFESGLNLQVLATNQDWIPTNFQSRLKEIGISTLVVYSENDIVVPSEFSRKLIDLIPSAQSEKFNSSGHWPFIEEPKRFNNIVGSFFDS